MGSKLRPTGYWSIERITEEAKKYNTKKDFRYNSSGAYHKAHKLGIIDSVCSHMKVLGNLHKRFVYKITFTDGAIYVGLTMAPETRFQAHTTNDNSAVYRYMLETGLEPTFELINENLLSAQEAAELETFIIDEYRKDGRQVLNSVRGGALGSREAIWTPDTIKKEALLYQSRGEFKRACSGAYRAAIRLKCLQQCCSHMKYINESWTVERVLEESLKYKTKVEFRLNNPLYVAAQRYNLLDEIYEKMGSTFKGQRTCQKINFK